MSLEFFVKVRAKIRDFFWQIMLDNSSIKVRGRLRILGSDQIHLGSRIFINGDAWIEAIREYEGVTFSPKLIIGNDVSMSNNVHISCCEEISIGDGVLFGSNIYVGDNSHGCYSGECSPELEMPPAKRKLFVKGPIIIGENVWLGDGVVVCPGVSIGAGSIIGANSVVTKSIPANSIAAGAPAKLVKRINEEVNCGS